MIKRPLTKRDRWIKGIWEWAKPVLIGIAVLTAIILTVNYLPENYRALKSVGDFFKKAIVVIFVITSSVLIWLFFGSKKSAVTVTKEDEEKKKKKEVERSTYLLPAKIGARYVVNGVIIIILIVLIGFAANFLFEKGIDRWVNGPQKSHGWYISFVEPKENWTGYAPHDKGFGECQINEDTPAFFKMRCVDRYGDEDIFSWDRSKDVGTWQRTGDLDYGGTFTISRDPNGFYSGYWWSKHKINYGPFTVYECHDNCAKILKD